MKNKSMHAMKTTFSHIAYICKHHARLNEWTVTKSSKCKSTDAHQDHAHQIFFWTQAHHWRHETFARRSGGYGGRRRTPISSARDGEVLKECGPKKELFMSKNEGHMRASRKDSNNPWKKISVNGRKGLGGGRRNWKRKRGVCCRVFQICQFYLNLHKKLWTTAGMSYKTEWWERR